MKKVFGLLTVFLAMATAMMGCPRAPQPSNNIEVSIDSYMETPSGDFVLAGWLQNQNGWEAEVPRGYVNLHFSGTPHLETRLIYTILDRDLRQATEEIVIDKNGYAQLVASKVFGVDDALLIVGLGILGYGSVLVSNQHIMAADMTIGNSFMFVNYGSNDWAINVPFGPNVLKCQIIQQTSAGEFQYWLYPEAGYDADGDSLPDSWERKYFNSLNQAWGGNADGDCLLNGEEMVWGLHPTSVDFDHDGFTDCEEIFEDGTDPFVFNDPDDIVVIDYKLSITTQGQGTVTGAGTYAAGTQVTISATPASGWVFDHWVINGTNASNNPGTVTMNSDVAVVAVFTSDANPGGLINVNLTWSSSVLRLAATGANPGVIGLELYHQTGNAPWVERQTFAVSSGNASGTVNKFRPNILRFGVVSSATTGGYIPLEFLVVKINNQNVPLVNQDGNLAFQVDVSTL